MMFITANRFVRKGVLVLAAILLAIPLIQPPEPTYAASARQMESLNRGVVAVKVSNGVFVSWRLFGTEPANIAFNLYRGNTKVNSTPITNSTNYLDPQGTTSSTYTVRAVLNGQEQSPSEAASVWGQNYMTVPIQQPSGGTTPDGVAYTYTANDASVGDLDGDGNYEIVLKWDPTNSKDNSQSGYTGPVYIDAYKLDGTRMWRINLGRNIRAGAHYTQFLVYDFDGDGRAEVVFKTADGTIDGMGRTIGNASADYRNSSGYILSGPEFLTVFDGRTGAALSTVNYDPPRGNVSDWGDNYGNRVDRFLAGVAYLDGQRPSIVMARGYYTRTVLVAYNWRNGSLTKLWTFDSNSSGNGAYAGQGYHSLSIADVDGDGRDEIIYGAAVIDDNGRGLYTTGLGHGDALHVSDFDPDRAGLEVFGVHESASAQYGAEIHNAATGQIYWGIRTGRDTGRGLAADIDPRTKGAELWASGIGLYSVKGVKISDSIPNSINFAIWWDGDLLRELLDHTGGTGKIDKWNYNQSTTDRLLTATGTASNNGTKGTPSLQADLFGDWREEVIWRTADNSALRIYTTTNVTNHRIYTLMHDPVYRLSIAWQNVAYNQPPHTGFYLGEGMSPPPVPNIYLTGSSPPVQPPEVSEGLYKLINPNSGKALDVYGNRTADGTNVLIYTDNGQINQQWNVTKDNDGNYKLTSPNSGKVLDVDGHGTADGTNVQIWSDNGGNNQKWRIISNSDGTYKIIGVGSNKALEVEGNGTANNTNVQIRTDDGSAGQKWQLVKL